MLRISAHKSTRDSRNSSRSGLALARVVDRSGGPPRHLPLAISRERVVDRSGGPPRHLPFAISRERVVDRSGGPPRHLPCAISPERVATAPSPDRLSCALPRAPQLRPLPSASAAPDAERDNCDSLRFALRAWRLALRASRFGAVLCHWHPVAVLRHRRAVSVLCPLARLSALQIYPLTSHRPSSQRARPTAAAA